jgi:glycine/serine hydroxymethyltransferase
MSVSVTENHITLVIFQELADPVSMEVIYDMAHVIHIVSVVPLLEDLTL